MHMNASLWTIYIKIDLLSCFFTVLSSKTASTSDVVFKSVWPLFLWLPSPERQINNKGFIKNTHLSCVSYPVLLWSCCGATSFAVGIFIGLVMKHVFDKIIHIPWIFPGTSLYLTTGVILNFARTFNLVWTWGFFMSRSWMFLCISSNESKYMQLHIAVLSVLYSRVSSGIMQVSAVSKMMSKVTSQKNLILS